MTPTPISTLKQLWQRTNKLFLGVVVIPTLASALYFGLIASDVYISQSKFVIYNPQTPNPATGLGGLLQGVGLGNNSNYAANAVHDYLLSRNALVDLQNRLKYQQLVSRKRIDPFNRFGGWVWIDTSFEQLYRYYDRMIGDEVNENTNISTLNVDAYTATDAQRINKELLRLAQLLVNRINKHANQDSVRFYQKQVKQAEAAAQATDQALARYRNAEHIFNPTPQANLQAALINKLEDQLLTAQLKLGELETSAPSNPQLPPLKRRIRALRRQIENQTLSVAGDPNSLASKSAHFKQLSLAQAFAERNLETAIASMEQARTQALKQQLFIETVVEPNRPDEALSPKRWRGFLATVVVGLMLWGVFSVIFAGIREHHER